MNKKVQIREINDIQGNKYKIYDLMVKNKFGFWKSVHTTESLKDLIEYNSNIKIEDLTKDK